jgi:hypothetical protein
MQLMQRPRRAIDRAAAAGAARARRYRPRPAWRDDGVRRADVLLYA